MRMVFKPNEIGVQKQNSFSSDHLLAMCIFIVKQETKTNEHENMYNYHKL